MNDSVRASGRILESLVLGGAIFLLVPAVLGGIYEWWTGSPSDTFLMMFFIAGLLPILLVSVILGIGSFRGNRLRTWTRFTVLLLTIVLLIISARNSL